MSEAYHPPFHMTEEITNLIVEIGEYVGSITTHGAMRQNPVLRRESRIKSIYSSLAIEQNTLSLDQVTDVIEGKRVLGPPQDIREVKNAIEAYKEALRNNPNDDETRYNLVLCQRQLKNDGNGGQNQQQQQQDQQDQQQQQEQEQPQQQQQQQQEPPMSKENAEQLLNAAIQNEKQTQDKLQKAQQQPQRRAIQKNW